MLFRSTNYTVEMSRQIKVRAWDKVKKRMTAEMTINEIMEMTALVFRKILKMEYRWQQSTCLFDKNGKEIFCEDIVKFRDNTGHWMTSEIIDAGCYLAIKAPKNPIPLYQFVSMGIYDGTLIDNIEVIGNVYENKELLNHKREIKTAGNDEVK